MATDSTNQPQFSGARAAAAPLADTLSTRLPVVVPSIPRGKPANAESVLGSSAQLLTSEERERRTVFYLAYGSNLCKKTFQGSRGIRPLGATNVVVPQLKLTFDLPGVPYMEPCFGNTADRDESRAAHGKQLYEAAESCERCQGNCQYRKDSWHKGLVGVVYELTFADFAHVMATEGGGTAYKDVRVTCYALPPAMDKEVSWDPRGDGYEQITAHTLFAPSRRRRPKARTDALEKKDPFHRPDPAYAQPSKRYIGLIKAGVDEHQLPSEYREYVARLRPYRITHFRQRVGQVLFATFFLPLFGIMRLLTRLTVDERGRAPPWVSAFMSGVFGLVWKSYDGYAYGVFGDGERTEGEDKDCDCGCHGGTDLPYLDEKGAHHQSLV